VKLRLPILATDEDEEDRRIDEGGDAPRHAPEPQPVGVAAGWIAVVAAIAALPRLGYLFWFANPENAGDPFTDAYHHWQIAYLTKEVGLTQGRLWDMRGWEYFWGAMHPLLMNALFLVTGSVDIVLARLLSLVFGCAIVVLVFLLCHRYWGMQVAVAAAGFAALSPVSIFNDDAGMAEPIAIALVLFGIWLAPRRGFFAGVAWGLAATARVEAWLFGAGLVFAWWLGRRQGQSRWPLIFGWVATMAVYCKFLFDATRNPIYPLWVNFQFVGLGAGSSGATLTPDQQVLALPLAAAVLGMLAGLAWALWRRPSSYLLLTFGFGYSALSLATYLRYATEWKERRFEWSLDFMAILVAVLVIKLLPERRRVFRFPGWGVAVAGIGAVQLLWAPIQQAYDTTGPLFAYEVQLAHQIGDVYNQPQHRGGVLNMPGDEPTLLYVLARDDGLRGDRVTSQFYDPFYYLPPGYRYADHKDVAGPLLLCWLWKTHTNLMLLSPPGPLSQSVADYSAFIGDHPAWFQQVGGELGNGWLLYTVDVPAPTEAECQAATTANR
jgi:hypothetical protein